MSSSDAAHGEAMEAMRRARSALVLEHPFFGCLILRLTMTIDPSCRDLWTNGRELGFNPAWVAVQSEACLEAACAHEMLHLACSHHIRRNGRNPVLWNQSCDHAVNLLLMDAGFTLPKNFPVDSQYADMSADAIFEVLTKLDEQDPHGAGKGQSQQKEMLGQREMDGKTGGGKSQNRAQGRAQRGQGESLREKRGEKAKAGRRGEKSRDGSEDAFVGEVRDYPVDGESHGEEQGRKKAERDARIALIMAMHRALHQGDMPGHFLRLFRQVAQTSLDWRGLLQQFLQMHVNNDYTWTVPNRRYLYLNVYLPSRSEPNIPQICLAVDSSGSVDEEKLALFCSELSSILEAYDTELTVLYHDTEVQKTERFRREDLPLHPSPQGGGGTDYRPVLPYIEREALHPTCLIWFTDLECSSFPGEPSYPVLWVTWGRTDSAPPFGEWIVMDEYGS